MHETYKATCTVAALFHLAPVGIENKVTKIRLFIVRFLDQQDLITAYANMPISQQSQLLRLQINILSHAVNNHKVVTRAVHFGEF